MMTAPKITFIGADSTILIRSILGDAFHREALRTAHIALMDIDPTRLEESHIMVRKLMDLTGTNGRITYHTQQKEALQGADFVMVTFQIGGYEPCTVTDFEVCKRHGLEQTIVGTLRPGDTIRVLRTVPYLRQTYEGMAKVCPDVTMLNYVNPMAMNTWAMYTRYPHIKQIGLCHSVQGTAEGLARDPNTDPVALRYRCAGINHMAFHLELKRKTTDGSYVNLYLELLATYEAGQAPKPNIHGNIRCQNIMRYEMFKKLGYFVTESSRHFAEYTPWFIKPSREDLIERCRILLDEYPKRYVEQLANWHRELEEYKSASWIDIEPSWEYASAIIDAIWAGEPNVIYGNVRDDGLIGNPPQGCCVEVACLADANDIQPTKVGMLPSHLATLIQTNVNVQALLTGVILTENRDRVYYVATINPHTAAVLGIDEIYAPVDDLIAAHSDWLPG